MSHALVDRVVQVRNDDVLRHVPLIKCTKRDQEVLGIKKAAEWKDYNADVGTTRKLGLAFQRRALAFEIAELCNYETMMVVVDRYMELLDNEALSVQQILKADEALTIELARECRAGIKARPGVCPVQDNIVRVFESQRIQLLLVPWQRPSQPKAQPQPKPQPPHQPKAEQPNPRKRGRGNGNKNVPKMEPRVERPAKGYGKDTVMPQQMVGVCAPRTSDEQNICFGFNLNSCPHRVEPGGKCQRGLHVCAKLKHGKACGGPHPFTACA